MKMRQNRATDLQDGSDHARDVERSSGRVHATADAIRAAVDDPGIVGDPLSVRSRLSRRLDLDERQLRFLEVLLRTQSITSAGTVTGLSQPTASRTYRRLIATLGDPLLVRAGNSAVLTPFAEGLVRHVDLRAPGSNARSTPAIYTEAGVQPPEIRFEIRSLLGSADAVLGDDLLAILPEDLARQWVGAGHCVVVPIADPHLVVEYQLVWHARVHRDSANVWARKVIVQTLSSATSAAPGPTGAPPRS